MMKHFLLKNADGSVQVMEMHQQPNGSHSTPEAEIAKWAPHKRDEVNSWREITRDDIPVMDRGRHFRDAWRDGGKAVDVDMPKARDIHRERLRTMRTSKLSALDIEMTRAFDDKAKQGEIEKRRQALRDVTADPAIEKASTPEELLAVLPDALK
jgi:hypothetical protein